MSNEIVEILLTAGLATQESSRNLNRDIKNLEKNNIGKLNLTATLSSESIVNLKNQISAIHKSLPNLDVTLSVNTSSSATASSFISQLDKQTTALVTKLDEVINRMDKVNNGGGRKPSGNKPFAPTEESAEKALKSVMQLEKIVENSRGDLQIISDKETGKVKQVITTIKNDLGQIEKKTYKAVIDIAVGEKGKAELGLLESTEVFKSPVFKDFDKNLEVTKKKLKELANEGVITSSKFKKLDKELDSALTNAELDKFIVKMNDIVKVSSKTDKMSDGFQKATNKMAELGKQGNLTEKEIKGLTEQLRKIGNIKELNKFNAELSNIGKANSHDNSAASRIDEIKHKTSQAIIELEKMRRVASQSGLDTKEYDHLINKMQQMSSISTTNSLKLSEAEKSLRRFSSQVSTLGNSTSTINTSFNTLNAILDTVSRSGLMTESVLNNIRIKIQALNASDLTMDEKVRRLKNEIVKLNEQLGDTKHTNKMSEGVRKAKNEIEKLEAQLVKTMNSYKRTVNMDVANSIGSQLSGLKISMPSFTNTTQVDKYMADLKIIERQIQRLNADATVGSRNNLSVIDAFKTAMEKFPIKESKWD